VAEHDRRRDRAGAVEHVEVAVADAGRGDAHAHLARSRVAHEEVVDHRQALAVEHRGARGQHTRSLRRRSLGRERHEAAGVLDVLGVAARSGTAGRA
jgi:hypothetical protein